MTTISASLVKELRDKTGVGMMDCKKALTETGGDVEAAVDWLRKKGLSKAAKKAGRIAAEGLVGIVTSGTSGSVVEVNSETDFVARNEQFQDMVMKITSLAGEAKATVAKLLATIYPNEKITVEDHIKEMIATIGENMTLRRATTLNVPKGALGSYVHNQIAPGLGKIGVLVALESDGKNTQELTDLARMIAMHVAATSPMALDLSGVPAETLAREKGDPRRQEPRQTGPHSGKDRGERAKELRQGALPARSSVYSRPVQECIASLERGRRQGWRAHQDCRFCALCAGRGDRKERG